MEAVACVSQSERMDKGRQVAKGKGVTQERKTACAKAQRGESLLPLSILSCLGTGI